jgi:sugar phosphate isomerase/epimerase
MQLDLCLFASSPDVAARGFVVQLLTGNAEELAYRSLSLGYNGFEFLPNPEDVPDSRPFRKALDATGVRLPVVNTGRMAAHRIMLFDPDPKIAGCARDAFRRIIEFAGELEADVGLGIARGPARTDLDAAAMDRWAEEIFCDLAATARRAGIRILLEPAETNVTRYILDVRSVMAWVDRINALTGDVQRVRGRAFDVMLDTHQLTESESSLADGIDAAQGMATHIHLFDPQRHPPGTHPQGIDWDEVFGSLSRSGFSGTASVIMPRPESGHTAQDVARFVRAHVTKHSRVATMSQPGRLFHSREGTK